MKEKMTQEEKAQIMKEKVEYKLKVKELKEQNLKDMKEVKVLVYEKIFRNNCMFMNNSWTKGIVDNEILPASIIFKSDLLTAAFIRLVTRYNQEKDKLELPLTTLDAPARWLFKLAYLILVINDHITDYYEHRDKALKETNPDLLKMDQKAALKHNIKIGSLEQAIAQLGDDINLHNAYSIRNSVQHLLVCTVVWDIAKGRKE